MESWSPLFAPFLWPMLFFQRKVSDFIIRLPDGASAFLRVCVWLNPILPAIRIFEYQLPIRAIC